RLLREFLARADSDVRSLRGRCLSYGDGITFWPLGEVVRSAASIADDDPRDVAVEKLQALVVETDVAERVGAAIGLSDRTFSIEETFWAARRLLERIAASAPLVVLIDDILHRHADGRWIVLSDIGAITIPPSISALLTARLDRLGATERSVIERGAVMGQVFFRGALEELVPDGVRTSVPASLDGLARKELIRRDEATQFAAQEAYRFLHILIRDAAYQGLLKRTRAELHEAFVDWLEQVTSGREMEYEEIR